MDLSATVPMYHISGDTAASEGEAAAHLTREVAERLRRLGAAYGEWKIFEPGPYFDLTPEQVTTLVRVAERVATVHVTFYLDPLLPSFQDALYYMAEVLQPAIRRGTMTEEIGQGMVERWQRLIAVEEIARGLLQHDIGYLAVNGASDERARWQPLWQEAATELLDASLLPNLAATPTLTLSCDFPLPAYRQPGRLRRLRRAWIRKHGKVAPVGSDNMAND